MTDCHLVYDRVSELSRGQSMFNNRGHCFIGLSGYSCLSFTILASEQSNERLNSIFLELLEDRQ